GAVEIKLQDLLLGQVRLEPDGEVGLLDLALERALVGQEQILGELLRDRGAALDDGVGAQVLDERAEGTEDVNPEMVEEAPVLGRDDRLDEMVRHLLQRHRVGTTDAALADLVAVAVEEGDGIVALASPISLGRLESWQP